MSPTLGHYANFLADQQHDLDMKTPPCDSNINLNLTKEFHLMCSVMKGWFYEFRSFPLKIALSHMSGKIL